MNVMGEFLYCYPLFHAEISLIGTIKVCVYFVLAYNVIFIINVKKKKKPTKKQNCTFKIPLLSNLISIKTYPIFDGI